MGLIFEISIFQFCDSNLLLAEIDFWEMSLNFLNIVLEILEMLEIFVIFLVSFVALLSLMAYLVRLNTNNKPHSLSYIF